MKPLCLLVALLFTIFLHGPAFAQAKEKKPYVIFAQMMEDTTVELTDGSVWRMDKGDCFPVHMFKDRQTVVILQLGGASFATEAYKVRIMKAHEEKQAIASYRTNVENYMKAQAEIYKERLKTAQP